jgi:hypothetical protein
MKDMRDKMATGDDICVDVFKLLGEDDLRIMTQLINNIYETGERSMDFNEVTTIALKKPRAMKCRNHCTISCITCTAKIAVRMPSRTEQKTEDELWRRSI